MSGLPTAIGVDVGGTKIAAAVVQGSSILESREVASPADDATEILESIVGAVTSLGLSDAPVGVAAAGFLDRQRESVVYSPNLAWRDVPLRAQLADRLGMPVILENDANAAAWGEFRFGAGEDCDSMVMVTIGTGVGGGVITNGTLLTGSHGTGAELGHLRVVSDLHPGGEPPRLCGCGSSGCWEMYGSGTALGIAARGIAVRPEGASLLERAGGDLDALTGVVVTDAANDGDPVALRLVDELGRWIGQGLASISAVLDPEVIAVGGGVAEAGDVVMVPLLEAYASSMHSSHRPPAEVRLAALGNRAGMLGAADLAHTRTRR